MLRRIGALPLDYSLCDRTVTVYHREGLTRQVLSGVYYASTARRETAGGREEKKTGFQLVVPGAASLSPGDKVLPGVGPEDTPWAGLNTAEFPELGVIGAVTPRYFGGKLVHTEARD